MTSVKGGTLQTAVSMRAQLKRTGVMDINTYQSWARSIADAPALIHSEVGIVEWLVQVFMRILFFNILQDDVVYSILCYQHQLNCSKDNYTNAP